MKKPGAEPIDADFLDVSRVLPQQAGLPELVREVHVPPKGHGLDIRWAISLAQLEKLLDVARHSTTGRAVVTGVSLCVRQWRTHTGHVYETYSFIGPMAVPESPVILSGSQGGHNSGTMGKT